jgi:hypothetical protein
MNMAEKYPLTEKKVTLREPTYKRWQYTLSGWIRLIRTDSSEEGAAMERQICDRMWEDQEFNDKIRAEFEVWLAQGPDMPMPPIKAKRDEWAEMSEDKLRRLMRKSVRQQGKYKGRGKEKRREP